MFQTNHPKKSEMMAVPCSALPKACFFFSILGKWDLHCSALQCNFKGYLHALAMLSQKCHGHPSSTCRLSTSSELIASRCAGSSKISGVPKSLSNLLTDFNLSTDLVQTAELQVICSHFVKSPAFNSWVQLSSSDSASCNSPSV